MDGGWGVVEVHTTPPLLHTTHNNTTTLHNTRVHKITNVPVVFIAWYVMVLKGAKKSMLHPSKPLRTAP